MAHFVETIAGEKRSDHGAEESAAERERAPMPAVELTWGYRAVRVLALVVGALVCAGLIVQVLRFGFGLSVRESLGFIRLFDLNTEANVPTWFSSILLAGCAAFLALIGLAKRAAGDRWTRHWLALGAIFALLSLDESASIHEMTVRLLHERFDLGPWFTNAWVLIAWPLLLVLGLVYARFLSDLPRRSCWLFLLSGAVYVGGASGVEVFSGLTKFTYGNHSLGFALVTVVEETLELLGLLALVYALTDYAQRQGIVWKLSASAPKPR